MKRERDVDVVILGGGPAGSTAGALLAAAGIGTLILEAEPRARAGPAESLPPHALPLLDRLGAHDAVRGLARTRRRAGTSFYSADGGEHSSYAFADARHATLAHGYHVRRDELDGALLDAARARGAEVGAGWRAVAPHWDGSRLVGLAVACPDGRELRLSFRALLDASGRQSFLASRMGWRFPYLRHRRAAVHAHFRGVWLPPGGEAENNTVVLADGGWFWLTPLADGTVSVGVVLDPARWRETGAGPEALFAAAVARAPEVARRLTGADRVSPFAAVRDFSYRVMRSAGDPFCLIGDAAGFFDPIAATGVLVAMATGASAADDLIDAFRRRPRVEANDLAPTVALTRSLHRAFFPLVRALHDPRFRPLLFRRRPAPWLPGTLASLLAGDVLRPGRWRRTGMFRLRLAVALLRRPAAAPRDAATGARPAGAPG